jgi:predicted RND superfamily exporter protein
MAAAGWEMGIGETICIIVVIGVSVDYSVHLAHAYNHSAAATRQEKVKAASSSMGISLLGGLATTIGASLFLAFADVLFFKNFGIFLVVTVIISIIASFGFLMPLLLLVGPEEGKGDIAFLQKWVVGHKCSTEFSSAGQ